MGVWIETHLQVSNCGAFKVTPYVGVWIETHLQVSNCGAFTVTPYVGVWIETLNRLHGLFVLVGHTLRGCVD